MNPLAELRDIHLPEPVALWPPAPGWWLLALLLVAIVTTVLLYTVRHLRKNRYRREAKKQLNALYLNFKENKNEHFFVININLLMKKVAANRYGKKEVSRLTAQQWLAFLDSVSNSHHFTDGPGKNLATAPYAPAPHIDGDALYQCCRQWIRSHQ